MQALDAEATSPFWLAERGDTHGIPPRRMSNFQTRYECFGVDTAMTVGRADRGERDVIDWMVTLRKQLTLPRRKGF